jgi:Holliday junction resolvasome RuvABC endonuclease subunit
MLHIPKDSPRTTRIVGIDPGSESLGFASIEFDIETGFIVKTMACTFKGSKMMKKDTWAIEVHGERASRIDALKSKLLEKFVELNPIQIVCEGAFFNNLRPNAFEVLVEVRTAIKQAISDFDCWRTIYLIDPPTVKKSVGAPGNADKVKVKACVLALSGLSYSGETPLDMLDEHSIDAIAIAYCRYKLYFNPT